MERDEILNLCYSNSEVIVSYIVDLESRYSDLESDIMILNHDIMILNLKILNFGHE